MILALLIAAAFALLVIAGLVWELGHPLLDNYPSRCPKCGAQALVRIDSEVRRRQLRTFSCRQCGAAYRENLDDTLTEM